MFSEFFLTIWLGRHDQFKGPEGSIYVVSLDVITYWPPLICTYHYYAVPAQS